MAYRLRRVEPAATSQARKSARLQSPFERARLGQSVAQLELDGERLAGGIVDRERDRDVEPPLRRPRLHVRYERRRHAQMVEIERAPVGEREQALELALLDQ